MSIKVKRGLAINLPTLEEGELGFTTDSYEMYVGSDNGNILLNNGEILIRRNNGMLQYAQSSRKNQWFDICSLEEIRGDQGVQGIQGIQGVKGDKGDKGERGIQGEKGNPFTYADFTPDQLRALKGEKGDTGAKGERGLTGDKGDRGVGLNYSWSGTRLGVKRDTDAQYTYVDLRGADGKDGKQGERGERGIQGEKGDTPSIAHLEQQVSDKSKELDTKFNTLTAKQQQDAEVVTARDGEVSLNARLERDLAKGKIHFVDVEGSSISTESEEGYLENVEIHGNTWQNAENLADIRSVGTKVEGQELYKIDVVSCGKNLFNPKEHTKDTYTYNSPKESYFGRRIKVPKPNTPYTLSVLSENLPEGHWCVINFYENGNTMSVFNINKHSSNTFSKLGFATMYSDSEGYVDITVYVQDKQSSKHWEAYLNLPIQLEEGTQATPYEPYQEDKLTILSPTPLEKVGDVADRIICKDGVWGVEKNVKDYAFNTNANFSEYKASSFTQYYVSSVLKDGKANAGVICGINDCFMSISMNDRDKYNKDYISCWTSNHIAFVTMPNMFDSVATFKSSLPKVINFKYVTTQPTFIPLPHSQQIKLRTFADRTNISFLTEIEGTIKAQVPKSLGATVNTHTSQIDNLNKELDRVKKLEESTVSTVTSYKAFTTVSETTQGYFEDVKLEGKTLVNLLPKYELKYNATSDYDSWYFTGQTYATGSFKTKVIQDVRPNTTYTLVYDVVKVPTTGTYHVNNPDPVSVFGTKVSVTPNSALGRHIRKLTSKESLDLTNTIVLRSQNATGRGDIHITNLMLLEGDHTDKDLNFFEGLKSVGQDSDEIEIFIPNKNILSPIKDKKYPYFIKKGTRLVLSEKNNTPSLGGNVMLYDINGNVQWFSIDAGETNPRYITVWEDIYYIKNALNGDLEYQVEVGIERTQYVPYSSNKKQVLYYNSTTQTWEKPILREWDSIEKHSDGKYYYHKRSEEVVLNGSENISLNFHLDDYSSFVFQDIVGNLNNVVVFSDKFSHGTINTTEHIRLSGNSGKLVINISSARLSSQSNQGFKTWLQANPVTVVYQLANEEVYECTNLDLITYLNETNLIVNSGAIQPKVTLKVLSNVSNVVKLLQEKVSVLENKFIKGLQQVLAGDMMSLAHLLYPEDFTLENDTPQVIPYIEEGDINE